MGTSQANGAPGAEFALQDLSHKNEEDEEDDTLDNSNAQTSLLPHSPTSKPSKPASMERRPASSFFGTNRFAQCLFGSSIMLLSIAVILLGKAANMTEEKVAAYCYTPGSNVPEYFQTTKTDFRGPRETGRAPFLANEDDVLGKDGREGPLELDVSIKGQDEDAKYGEIFRSMGHLSIWTKSERGFGVDEFPIPDGAKISQVHMLHRHGARYDTSDSLTMAFAKNLSTIAQDGHEKFTDKLSFLNEWSYGLGGEILVPYGRQQLYESGVAHYYTYGGLYNTSAKLIARTTTQDRMLESAENFLAGFFGLDWSRNVSLETIIEKLAFNNSLAGYDNCPNANRKDLRYGDAAQNQWLEIYLKDTLKRLQDMSPPAFTWTAKKAFAAQQLCPYETVAFGYSKFCALFDLTEWEGFEYAIDLSFAGDAMFQSPTGRAVGIGWVEELLARLNHQLITEPTAQDNVTLDGSEATFPLDQSLYFDFSHDTNIASVLTALGMRQFAPLLPADGPPGKDRKLKVSEVTPFAGRLVIEIITAPKPIKAARTREDDAYEGSGNETKYIRLLLNSRTLPFRNNKNEFKDRSDGWLELGTFMDWQKENVAMVKWEDACFRDYKAGQYGDVDDGVP